jgi:uncharacterized protein DUF4153
MTTALSSPRTRIGLTVLGLGLGLGLLSDLLLRATPWGVNLTLCALALVAAGVWTTRRFHFPVAADAPWLALSVVLCAAAFVRRDSNALHLIDVGALAGAIALTALAVQGASVRLRGLSAYLLSVCVACAHAWFGGLRLVFADIPWRDIHVAGRWRRVGAVGIGLLLAAPLLALFGQLFVSADATFAAFVSGIRVDWGTLTSHVFLTGVFATLAAGTLRGAFLGTAGVAALGERLERPGLPPATTATVLGALDLLFVLFVALQARWLFGGAALIQSTAGLTAAEYARRGFFELVTAAALVVPVLLVAEWATRREDGTQERSFRALALLLVLLVGVLLVSAVQRMLLYVQYFGLTELRLYTTAFMVWLGGVFVWLAWTVLRGARARFAFGALVQGTAVLAALHVANPDALITRVNASRVATAAPFDAAYAAGTLSADAVPALLDALPRLAPAERGEVVRRLLGRWGSRRASDWRSWNWAAARARSLVRARTAELRQIWTGSRSPVVPRLVSPIRAP